MKRIINTILISVASVLLSSCGFEESYDAPMNETIVIDLSSGLTKAEFMADNPTEEFVNHIDVVIFDDAAGTPGSLKHHGRYVVNNAPRLTINERRSSFDVNAPYHVYLVANSNLPEADFKVTGFDYSDFVTMKQTDELLHLTGLAIENSPKYFLMDAKATDGESSSNTLVVMNNGNSADNTVLYATLRRAAAKVMIKIKAGPDVQFASFNSAAGGLVSDGGLYYIQNLPYQAFLLAEARADDMIDATVVNVRNTARGYDGHFNWNPGIDNTAASLVTYVYPNSWSTDIISRETCAIVNLPLIYTPPGGTPVEHHNSWYKIHMTGEKLFRRNNYYEVNVTINRPGAISETVPVDIENVSYAVEPWTSQIISVGGDDKPRYLSVNKTSIEMHNIAADASTLEFASSSPVTITVSDAFYHNKFGQKTQIPDSILDDINGVTDGGIAGNITVNSPVPANNAIRYFTLVITNQEGLTKEVEVTQYPLEYITNQQGWYSYRSDFYTGYNGPTTYENKGSRRVAADWNGSSWNYSTSVQNNYFFGSKVSSMNSDGTSDLYYYSWGQYAASPSRNAGNLGALDNARMYHVQITASSGKYTIGIPKIDADGFTDDGGDNAKLVSPSFMIASQLGATQPPSSVEQAERHCREYVEVHDPDNDPATDNAIHYDNWRLPTAAEIQIIIDFQYVENAAMDEVLSGPYYWSATGKVRNPGSSDSDDQSAVRCIRDVY